MPLVSLSNQVDALPNEVGDAPPITLALNVIFVAPSLEPPISAADIVNDSFSAYPLPGRFTTTFSMAPPEFLATLKDAPEPDPPVVAKQS